MKTKKTLLGERMKIAYKKWYDKNKNTKEYKDRRRKYYQENKETYLQKSREKYRELSLHGLTEELKAKRREYQKRYHERNKEMIYLKAKAKRMGVPLETLLS